MELPNRKNAYISPSKLKDYLLSETHSVGKAKAKLFRTAGFNETNVALLKEGLLAIAHSGQVIETKSSPHGVKYVIDGLFKTPDGNSIKMRTVWIIDKGRERPRFVTAYPA